MENCLGRDCVNNISKQLEFEYSTHIAFQSSHQQQDRAGATVVVLGIRTPTTLLSQQSIICV